MKIDTLRWVAGSTPRLEMIDQRILPRRFVMQRYTPRDGAAGVARAIKTMVVRGAPAIGVAAAYGMALQALQSRKLAPPAFHAALVKGEAVLAASRPTAVNLAWALKRMRAVIDAHRGAPPALADKLVALARRMHTEDVAINRAIGKHGAPLLPQDAQVLTHCNAGALATAGYGTALGVIRAAKKHIAHVWVDETRPFLQGARLTAWELLQEKIPCTLITDNMAAHFMARGEVDAIVVGADRVAANGDVANKIGTYGLALLARAHRIPFYVAAPLSTLDFDCPNGAAIPIEERGRDEVIGHAGVVWAPRGVPVAHPAFDVTPARLVTALITEHGVVAAPNRARLKTLAARA
ncbi:MAG TPA: S-methyl-5-thioribose-1-phosphate isomerase [Burkholderiales bacterium]